MSSLKCQIGVQSFFSFRVGQAHIKVDIFSGDAAVWWDRVSNHQDNFFKLYAQIFLHDNI